MKHHSGLQTNHRDGSQQQLQIRESKQPNLILRAAIHSILIAGALNIGLAAHVQAAPAACQPKAGDPTHLDCTGDQSQGVSSDHDFDPGVVTSLNVHDLTKSISAPALPSTTSGVKFDSTAPKGVRFNDVTVNITGTVGAPINIATSQATGVFVQTLSGVAYDGRGATSGFLCAGAHSADPGDMGPSGNNLAVNLSNTSVSTSNANALGIRVSNSAGNGGYGGGGTMCYGSEAGGAGGHGGQVTVTGSNASVSTAGPNAMGISVSSNGGNGGHGGDGGSFRYGSRGGIGGVGGEVDVSGSGTIHTNGTNSLGIFAISVGGNGGDGGSSDGFGGGGNGPYGAGGGLVHVDSGFNITTDQDLSYGIGAYSLGGHGGTGGDGTFFNPSAGSGGGSGASGNVWVRSTGNIKTSGAYSFGIVGQSIAGYAGSGGSSNSVVNFGASGGSAGGGGEVDVFNYGSITTSGQEAHAIFVESIGGGGGAGGGGFAAFYADGGSGGSGGNGGVVTVTNGGTLSATGKGARGIYAQSIGGAGGDGGDSSGIVAMGGHGSDTSDGDSVTVTNSGDITSSAHAIFSESIGGGGGNGGDSKGWFSVGGGGGAGGKGGVIHVVNHGSLSTTEDNSSAIFAHSIGGGGGNGGSSIAGGVLASVALGGTGAKGGDGDTVFVHSDSGFISTGSFLSNGKHTGDYSSGIYAQSIGGGGGNGGFAISAAVSTGGSIAIGIGGHADTGGNANTVTVENASSIQTIGDDASALFAQSIGGGGGNGGFSIAMAAGDTFAGAVSVGGGGAGGGDAEQVKVSSSGDLNTYGDRSYGLMAQSVGGGGGNGGFAIAGTLTVSGVGVGFGLGGNGDHGGVAKNVFVDSSSNIVTRGNDAHGLFAQSLGGGGGSGGFSVAGSISAGGAADFAVGGSGAGGGSAGNVTVGNTTATTGTIHTYGNNSYGLLAESIGGGGGAGGFAVAGSITDSASAQLALGGKGGKGSNAGTVTVNAGNSIMTEGDNAHGLFAQSLGGGGGNGGFAVAGSISFQSGSVGASIGGSGNGGGDGNTVVVNSSGTQIFTRGTHSYGLTAQSVGGGGGDGGFSVAGSITNGPAATLSMGGSGSHGGLGRDVSVLSSTEIITTGDESHALFAQSLGGGGGSGGFSVAGSISSNSGTLGASIGGSGGPGGNAGAVNVGTLAAPTSGDLMTLGARSYGLVAQSIGGGGGDGGFSVAGGITQGAGAKFSLGGNGDYGGDSSAVSVVTANSISTRGAESHGLFAQSVGGGGGSGGFSVAGSISSKDGSLNASIGGFGDGGGNAAKVDVIATGQYISTQGDAAHGLFAQSIGGGGGNGGFSVAGSVSKKASVNLSLGGFGAGGGASDNVTVISTSSILTMGAQSHAIFAQSVGGGGGNGGFSIAGSLFSTDTQNPSIDASVGGFGGGGGSAGEVRVGTDHAVVVGGIETRGEGSYGIFAQSIGGGGGNGGFSVAGGVNKSPSVNFSVGGFGAGGGDGKFVGINTAASVTTSGDNAHALFAQSIGGGGGNGGFSIAGSASSPASKAKARIGVDAAAGGDGAGGGRGGDVNVTNTGDLGTTGNNAYGLYAQSIGGAGGNGGFAFAGALTAPSTGGGARNIDFAIGGWGGSGNIGGDVVVSNAGSIQTTGNDAHAILAHSIGGGGGNGGFAVSGSLNALSSQSSASTASIAVSIGGMGGHGNLGGAVTVTNDNELITIGDGSRGIYAYSTGGGGGNGGAAYSIDTDIGQANKGNAINMQISVGGSGGSGNIGGVVGVRNDGDIHTSGMQSDAIYAESIGGGGGNGGDSHAVSFDFTRTNQTGGTSEGSQWNVTATVGGNAGSADDGNAVDVTNHGMITTAGVNARGIVARSVGGGGGAAGSGISGTGINGIDTASDLLDLKDKNVIDVRNWSLAVGGNGGESGNGLAVHVTNTGRIVTSGLASTAIVAQSIGGGGGEAVNFAQVTDGNGGAASCGINSRFAIGGAGGSSGNGGDVTAINSASIETFGADAHGIFAQSVGGGGGVAGNVDRGLGGPFGPLPALNVGIGLGFGQAGGSAGNGGNVTVTNNSDIATHGDGAFGIFAQSIGGGGGAAGGLGNGGTPLAPVLRLQNFYGSTGGAGDAGAVTVNQVGNINVSGAQSIGIFAQSNTTDGISNAVNISVDGDIHATGRGAFGILAQSLGAKLADNTQSSGDITININSGSVTGGRGFLESEADASTIAAQTDADKGAAVNLRNGSHNVLNNHGVVGDVNDLARMAILGSEGNITVNNFGYVAGSVNLGSGKHSFNNYAGATLFSGSSVTLGAGNTLTNQGNWSVGNVHSIAMTVVTGNIAQSTSGHLLMDIDYATGNSDRVNIVQGNAAVSGTVDVQNENVQLIKPGTTTFMLMSADQGVTTDTLKVIGSPSIVMNYSLTPADYDTTLGKYHELLLKVTTDFADNPNGVMLSRNQYAVGAYFNAVQLAGSSAALSSTVQRIVNSTDGEQLKQAYDALSPAGFGVSIFALLGSNTTFTNAMMSCRQGSGDNHFVREGQCGWFAVNAGEQRQSTTASNLGFNRTGYSVAGGLQFAISDAWHVGFGIANNKDYIFVDRPVLSRAQSIDGSTTQAGIVAKGTFGNNLIAFNVSGGSSRFSSTRTTLFDSNASSKQSITFYAAQLRLAHTIDNASWYWRPLLDARLQKTRFDAFQEQGADANDLNVAAHSDTFVVVEPALEIGCDLHQADSVLRPFARVGVSRFVSGDSVGLAATLQGAPQSVAPFTAYQSTDKTVADLAAGVDAILSSGMVLKLGYEGQLSSHSSQYSMSAKISVPF